MNEQLTRAKKLPDKTMTTPAETGLIAAHPHHVIEASPGKAYSDEYKLPPVGHGPLRIHHTGLCVRETKEEGDWVLHRVAWGGALSLDPLSHFRSAYNRILAQVPLDHWRNGARPGPQDLDLYQIARLHV